MNDAESELNLVVDKLEAEIDNLQSQLEKAEVDEAGFAHSMSPKCGELFGALAKAQGQLAGAKRGHANDHYGSKYADLEAVWDAIREPLAANGLAVIQSFYRGNKGTVLVSVLGHESGEWIRSEVPVKPDPRFNKKTGKYEVGVHQIASAITYMRRYALMSLVGVSPTDDDGNAAAGL